MLSHTEDKPRVPIIAAILALLTLAVYWRVTRCDFINLDDGLYVTANPTVQSGLTWAGLKWAFQSQTASNWHPLTWLSHMLDYQLFGLKPGAYHLVNLLFHIANTLLLFEWLRRLTGALWRSALVAALFAWHPLHVESVAWISERKDVLSAFFWMLTLLAHQKYKIRNTHSKSWYLLALGFFILGLLAKPMLVTLPFALLLIDYWMAQSEMPIPLLSLPWKKWLLEKIPFFALVTVSCVLTYLAQKQSGAVESLRVHPLGQRAANAAMSYVRYLGKTFCPADLVIVYPHPGEWDAEMVIAAIILLLCITGLVLWFSRGRPWLPVGWFWYLGTLVPVIGIVQVGRQSMADRYTYIPSIGVFVIVAWGLCEWAQRNRTFLAASGAAAAALAACLMVTWNQVGYWKNSETLFKRDIELVGPNYLASYALASFCLLHNRIPESVSYFDQVSVISPLDETNYAPVSALAHFYFGTNLFSQGDFARAAQQFSTAIHLEPGKADYHLGLSMALAKEGKSGDAIAELNSAAKQDPANPEIQAQIAALFSKQHQTREAIAHDREAVRLYRAALQHDADSPALLNNLAWMLATNPNEEIRNGPEAVKVARRACEVTHWKEALFIGTLAAACAEAGQFDEAATMARKARDAAAKAGQHSIAERNEELLKLYLAKKPYRDNGD